MAACSTCGARPTSARGLCRACYQTAYDTGTFVDHPRQRRAFGETVEEFHHLTAAGLNRAQVADRLRITVRTLERALAKVQPVPEWAWLLRCPDCTRFAGKRVTAGRVVGSCQVHGEFLATEPKRVAA